MGLSAVDYLRWQIVALLGIVGLDEFPQLDLLVRFVILQALSTGTIDHTSASLHGIVIGPPGRGKKLLGLVAKLLHATCVELSPSKVSLAGLVGAASHDRSGWKSSPGALARASLGVVHLQDAHCWSPSMVRMLAPVLQEVMEDGVTRDSVAGGLTRETQTALLIDLNRNEHVGLAGETPFLAARPLPSRADLLSEIPPDARQSWKVGRQMFGGGGQGGPLDDTNPNVRALRVLVAALRDRIPVVHLGPALPRMQELYGQIEVNYADMIDSDPEAGDVPTRMTVSMKRFAAAAARAGQRTEAIAADAEAAMPFLEMKLKFLQSRSKTKKSVSPIGVDEFLRGVGPGPFRSAALAEQYTTATGECCSERTMRRGLRAAGARRVGKGEYALDNWTSGQANDGSDGEKP